MYNAVTNTNINDQISDLRYEETKKKYNKNLTLLKKEFIIHER